MKMGQEEVRKGPWTEQEDLKLVSFVSLFGDRRWDLIAKVSGLHRTGKSCRLRWVNYLHPGLKRGKMTPQEERLVLELHSKWGNRWSKIARKLPGRTDNEIKNYWRTYMRKEAQKKTKASSPKSASSTCYSSSSSDQMVQVFISSEAGIESFYDTGGATVKESDDKKKDKAKEQEGIQQGCSVDDIWKDITVSDVDFLQPVYDGHSEEGCNFSCPPITSPSWEYSAESLWKMDEEESKMFFPIPSSDQLLSCYELGDYLLTV